MGHANVVPGGILYILPYMRLVILAERQDRLSHRNLPNNDVRDRKRSSRPGIDERAWARNLLASKINLASQYRYQPY